MTRRFSIHEAQDTCRGAPETTSVLLARSSLREAEARTNNGVHIGPAPASLPPAGEEISDQAWTQPPATPALLSPNSSRGDRRERGAIRDRFFSHTGPGESVPGPKTCCASIRRKSYVILCVLRGLCGRAEIYGLGRVASYGAVPALATPARVVARPPWWFVRAMEGGPARSSASRSRRSTPRSPRRTSPGPRTPWRRPTGTRNGTGKLLRVGHDRIELLSGLPLPFDLFCLPLIPVGFHAPAYGLPLGGVHDSSRALPSRCSAAPSALAPRAARSQQLL